MMIKPTYKINDSDILKIVREANLDPFIDGVVDDIAPLFWPEQFMNDCYKELFIDDESYDEVCKEIDWCLNPENFDQKEMDELIAKKVIIKALRDYCVENNIETDSLLVDVSW